jgi:hypothetical protein
MSSETRFLGGPKTDESIGCCSDASKAIVVEVGKRDEVETIGRSGESKGTLFETGVRGEIDCPLDPGTKVDGFVDLGTAFEEKVGGGILSWLLKVKEAASLTIGVLFLDSGGDASPPFRENL